MEAYCVKCKTKREMTEAKPEYTASGTAATRGKCPVCGTTLYRMGATPEHANIPKPDPVAKSDKPRKKRASTKNGKGKNGSDAPRSGTLVIVESPAKAKTIGRFLGKGYTVKPSVGHVRDLLRSTLSVDVEHDFTPKYRVPNEKKEVVKDIKKLAQKADEVFLATDPDREGEAISWHLLEAAEIEPERAKRVVFHEITESAIKDAFS
ncbi:MAG TPA: toprim domain-containing protein, partial [Anaerolineae bacterium]|nr:toprim domain-containing protein [Anaerolineae bacterium]